MISGTECLIRSTSDVAPSRAGSGKDLVIGAEGFAKRAGHRSRYRLRKQIVEPVIGQVKQARGFRQFLLRGLHRVRHEWALLCTAHNLLKLAASR